jgi:hypothetical protein
MKFPESIYKRLVMYTFAVIPWFLFIVINFVHKEEDGKWNPFDQYVIECITWLVCISWNKLSNSESTWDSTSWNFVSWWLEFCKVRILVRKKFQIFVKTVIKQKYISKEIKTRLNSRNACYHLIQNILSSHLQSKNLKVKIYKNL